MPKFLVEIVSNEMIVYMQGAIFSLSGEFMGNETNCIVRFVILVVISSVVSGCAPMPNIEPTQKSNLTVGYVKTQVIKGKTDQAQVMEFFGAPNIITKNKNNNEVWNYNKMSFQRGSGEASDVWFGSRAISSTTTSSFDLIIIFDNKDVVKDYSIISSSF